MKQRLIENDEEEAQKIENAGPVDFTRKFSLQDERLYLLPGRTKCDFDGTRGKYKFYDQLMADQPQQLQQATNLIIEHFKDIMTAWELPHKFEFTLPPTYFNVKIDVFADNQNEIGHQQQDVRELSGQHLSQIFQNGTFTIPSVNFPIPYVWKLSTWIMKGRVNIIESYYNDLAVSYQIFRWTYERFYHKTDYKGYAFPLTVRAGIYNLLIKPFLYISLIIGFRETKRSRNGNYAALLLETERQRKLKDEGNFSQEIYKFLEVKYVNHIKIEDNYKKLKNYADQFYKIADGIKFQIENLFDLQNDKKKPQILQEEDEEKLEFIDQIQQKLNMGTDYLKQYNLKFDPNLNIDKQINDLQYEAQIKYWKASKEFHLDMIQNIIDISECKRIFYYHHSIYSQSINKIQNEFEVELRKNHPIKTKIYDYVVDEIESHMEPIRIKLEQEMHQNILSELNEMQIIDRYVYQDYLEFCKTFEARKKRIYAQYGWKERNYQFQLIVTRRTFPPYDVVQINNIYYLVRSKSYTITTKYPFWRLSIGFLRWYTWTMNVMFYLFANAFSGPFGLRALFGISEFHPDVTIDSHTGVVRPSDYTVQTLICHLSEVYRGMKESRDNFERQPDTGFFGKNCARICNLIEVYLFRFLIVGVFCVMICYPILIILNVAISLLFALTAWLYMPFVLFLCFIFQLLIYDFDYELDGSKIWQTDKCFPMITNTLRWMGQGFLQLFGAILAAFVILPLLSILIFIYAHLRYLLRSLYDTFMICLIYCFGRIPARNTSIAWRISGPGISRQFYYQISNENVLILVAAELEKIILQKYQNKVQQLIDEPSKEIDKKVSSYFNIFGLSKSFNDPGCKVLKKQLEDQMSIRRSMYPKFYQNSKIRFTEQELKHLLIQVKQFVKSQIVLKDMTEYIWSQYQIKQGDYNGLVEKIVKSILGNQVFEPFEDLEMRFQMKEAQGKELQLQIRRALAGQVDLEIPRQFVIKQKEELIEEPKINFKKFISYGQIIQEINGCQSHEQDWCSVTNGQWFYVNYSLI